MFGDLLSRPFWGVVRGCLERRIGAAVRETDAESEGRERCNALCGSREPTLERKNRTGIEIFILQIEKITLSLQSKNETSRDRAVGSSSGS